TKGEWKVVDRTLKDSSGYLGDFSISNIYGEKAAQVYPYEDYGITIDRARANAKLIAAAPDMLEVLLILNGDIDQSPVRYTKLEKKTIMQEAIKKALGE